MLLSAIWTLPGGGALDLMWETVHMSLSNKRKIKILSKWSILSSIQKWELLQGITNSRIHQTEKTRQFSNPGRL